MSPPDQNSVPCASNLVAQILQRCVVDCRASYDHVAGSWKQHVGCEVWRAATDSGHDAYAHLAALVDCVPVIFACFPAVVLQVYGTFCWDRDQVCTLHAHCCRHCPRLSLNVLHSHVAGPLHPTAGP